MKTVRDGQIVWPYCPRCGCRLELNETEKGEFYFRHYGERGSLFSEILGIRYVDARGCACVDDYWALDDRIIYQGTRETFL